MGGTQNRSRRTQTTTRQPRSNYKNKHTKQREGIKFFSRSNTSNIKLYRNSVNKNRHIGNFFEKKRVDKHS